MRVSTAFNTMLAIPGASVAAVRFESFGVVVALRRRSRRPQCPCGWKGRASYDRSMRRWRHLDLGGARLFLEAEVRRLECRRCQRVRTELVPWARPGLGEAGCRQLQAVSLDMGHAAKLATDRRAPAARQCVDPFHLIKMANEAVDRARKWAWNEARRASVVEPRRWRGRPRRDAPPRPLRARVRWTKHTRWALLKDPDALSDGQWATLDQLRRERSVLYRCWQLKEGLRDLYRLARPADAPTHLDWWLAWACRSRIPSFVRLSLTVRRNRERILAAVELGISNSKLEGLNSKIRLINHRGYGHHSAAALIAMIYLCCSGVTVELPFR